ncbi:cyclin-D5-1-like [Gastrolobium bilobum]|uniref:cyclin-D5-1-like n=1 Tax=Gastrolobium bilobum TaxID=150636 RepID=UPI002AB06152|nr:cyclin-D5-1-like [Gastrolobium bilobum]
MDDDLSSSLLCQENQTFLEGDVGDEEYSFIQLRQDCGVSEDEHVGVLIEREISLGFKKDETLAFGDWVKRARLDSINWILKTRATLGFRLQTAYLSVTYFDRFLSRRSIDSEKYWAIRLLSVACLSLAAKMEECNVPGLSGFRLEDYCFESKVIQKMELLVLSTLEWNMGVITPFAFLSYFITKFCNESPSSPIFSKTMPLIFTTMEEVNLMDHKPSVIAAAATLVALDQQLTVEAVELKMSSIPQHWFPEPRDVFVCYNLIQRLYVEKTRRDKLLHTPNSSLIRSKPIDMIESSLVTSSAMTKRRRLTFIDDKDSPDGKGLHQGNPKF